MPTLKLDTDRPLKWTMRTDFKLGGLSNPPSLSDIGSKNGRKAFHALCCHVWACLQDGGRFESPEDIAEYLGTTEQQLAAMEALTACLHDAGMVKKKDPAPA